MKYSRVIYDTLNAKQKESYNYQIISAVLADYGFITVPLSNDWNGADFLAIHKDGDVLKVQLKGRMTFDKKYIGKDLFICFRNGVDWFIYPHDEILDTIASTSNIKQSDSWQNDGAYSFRQLSGSNKALLEEFKIANPQKNAA